MKKFIIADLVMTSLATATQAVYHKNLPVNGAIGVIVESGKIQNKNQMNMPIYTSILEKGTENRSFESVVNTSPGHVYSYNDCTFNFNKYLNLVFMITRMFDGEDEEPVFECDGVTYSYEDTLVNVRAGAVGCKITVSWKKIE